MCRHCLLLVPSKKNPAKAGRITSNCRRGSPSCVCLRSSDLNGKAGTFDLVSGNQTTLKHNDHLIPRSTQLFNLTHRASVVLSGEWDHKRLPVVTVHIPLSACKTLLLIRYSDYK